MKKANFLISSCIFLTFFTSACTTKVQKEFKITGSNPYYGIVEVSFDFLQKEIPDFTIEQPYNLALQQCEAWGYRQTTQSEPLTENCVSLEGQKCIRRRAITKYQCN